MGEEGGEGKDGRMSPIQRSPGDVQSTGGERQAEKKAARSRPRTPLPWTPESRWMRSERPGLVALRTAAYNHLGQR